MRGNALNYAGMSEFVPTSISKLLSALTEEANDCLGACHLVTVDFENVVPDHEAQTEVDVTRLKVSARSCFLQACLKDGDRTVFKGRAIFKAFLSQTESSER